MTTPLRLQVTDDADLVVLSSVLQDATVLIGDMAHDPEQGQFLMVAARHSYDDQNRRHLTGVNFSGISSVRRRGFSPEDRDRVLNLLAVSPYQNGEKAGGIELVFSGKSTIRLECARIRVYAADLGEGWHTAFQPKHDV